jgi:hypothetical protein
MFFLDQQKLNLDWRDSMIDDLAKAKDAYKLHIAYS